MDFANATLVHLAKRESITTVCTVDRGDFETCRIDGPPPLPRPARNPASTGRHISVQVSF